MKAKLLIILPIFLLLIGIVGFFASGQLFIYGWKTWTPAIPEPEYKTYETYLEQNPNPTLTEEGFFQEPGVLAWSLYDPNDPNLVVLAKYLISFFRLLIVSSALAVLVTAPIGIYMLIKEKTGETAAGRP